MARVDRKESYKAQKRSYRMQKKKVAKELLSTFKDESIIVLADWLKVRCLSYITLNVRLTSNCPQIPGPRQPQELDQAVVRAQAWAVAAL